MTRFNYPRHNLSIRVSSEMDKQIEQCADALHATKTDVVIYAIACLIDPTGHGTPDVKTLPDELRMDFEPSRRMADHFFSSEPDTKDWEKVLGDDLKVPH